MKKYIFRFMIVFCSSCLFFGCGKKEEEPGKNIPTSGGDTIDNTNILDNQEDTSDEEKEHSEDVKLNQEEIKNTSQNKVQEEEIIFELLENYKEKNIPSVYTPDNETERYCNVLLNQDREIEYYTLSEENGDYSMWKYTLKEEKNTLKEEKTKEVETSSENLNDNAPTVWSSENGFYWTREPISWIEEIKSKISYGRVFFFHGEDLNDYAWYIGEGEIPHLVKREENSCTEILIPDWRITEQAVVAVLENGNIVSADAGRECFVYHKEDGSLLKRFDCGWYESICVRGNLIYITTRGGSSVQCYDAQKQEFLPTIEAGFDNSVRIALQEDNIYVCTPKGIFCAKENETNFQKILEAGTFHFAKDTGTLLKFFVIGEAFYVVYGEDKGCIKGYFPAAEGEVASNSLTIYSLESNDIILDIISEFQNQYPDIELSYETGEGGEGSISSADRIRALNARILAGDGPDILLMDGLPAES